MRPPYHMTEAYHMRLPLSYDRFLSYETPPSQMTYFSYDKTPLSYDRPII